MVSALKSQPDKLSRFGKFTLAPGEEFLGTLLLDGQDSRLYLRDNNNKRIPPSLSEDTKITGVLDDQTTVSIIGRWNSIEPSRTWGPGGFVYFYELSPEYVVIGSEELAGKEEKVTSIQFVPEDWEALFGWSRPFGSVLDNKAITKKLMKLDYPDREPDLGKHQLIFYWTGKHEVFSCPTPLGSVSAFHKFQASSVSAKGFRLDSKVHVAIKFDQPISFEAATGAMRKILMFFDYLVGRVQNRSELEISLNEKELGWYKVHSCIRPRHDRSPDHLSSDRFRSFINLTQDPDGFGKILSSWLSRESECLEARWNLLNGWRNPHYYSSDRIVRSANLFDLIPKESYPEPQVLPPDVETALSNVRTEIKKLSKCIDNKRLMSAVWRVGKHGLREKISHRADMVAKEFGDELPEIKLVCKEAVDTRNRYVHGSSSRITVEEHTEVLIFLVDTLEFVFVISDLINAGWRESDWDRVTVVNTHPFQAYLRLYRENLEKLKTVLGK